MKKIMLAALAASLAIPTVANAQWHDDQGYRGDHQYDRRDQGDRGYQNDRVYRGNDGRYDYGCKRSKGTTGLIAGGAGGALLGNVLGGGALGTIAGGVGGALLGQHLDKKHDAAQNRNNGC